MLSKSPIKCLINLVKYEVEQIETRDECRRQVDVSGDGQIDIVPGANRISCCKYGGASIEGCDNSCFCDRNCLLFLDTNVLNDSCVDCLFDETYHHLVQYTSCCIRHLVEFVDATYTTITQNEGTTANTNP